MSLCIKRASCRIERLAYDGAEDRIKHEVSLHDLGGGAPCRPGHLNRPLDWPQKLIQFTVKRTSNDGSDDAMNLEVVKDYYGKVLKSSKDLKTSACCDCAVPAHLQPLLANVHEEVRAKYYGCGIVLPAALAAFSISALAPGATFI